MKPLHTPRRLAATATAAGTAGLLVAGLLTVGAAPATAAPGDPAPWAGNSANTLGGTDYYIDATEGDDAATGKSPQTAWKSLAKASEAVYGPGDRILLQAGETWRGQQLTPQGAGAEDRPVKIDAYGESTARPAIHVDGKVPSPFTAGTSKNYDTVGKQGAVNLQNTQYWEIANLEISNDDDFATNITAPGVVRDGISVSINADKIPAGADNVMDYFRVSNLYIHDIDGPSAWQRIHYGGINFQVFGSKQYGEYPTGANYFQDVRIENNTFDKVELHAVQFGFNWFGDAVGYNDATGKFHEGWEQLWVRDRDLLSRDVYIGHNYASDTGQGAIQLANTKDMIVEYNEINGFLRRYNQVSAGLYLWAGADTIMRYNEVYDGPANEYDATPWDLEYTNQNVTYEYNYSHDNQGGWMSYMGNSDNSIARYNLSVNDNGVIVKNMLSTNYTPTYFLNNVFVYDGSKLHQMHDEVFKSRVYFANNVFYNTSTTTPTTWSRKDGALNNAVFSNNAMFEASGQRSPLEPADAGKVTADPEFVEPIEGYLKRAGVENILDSASRFQVKDTSPLIDAGRYNERIGDEDFFGTELYYGDAPDIGIQEKPIGAQVVDPVDTDPIENEGVDTRVNLALGKTATATSTHPHQNFSLNATKLTDGDPATRWAAADEATFPIDLDIDFGAETAFTEVELSEFIDSGTNARVENYLLQRWDAATSSWVTFSTQTGGIGATKSIKDFGIVTSSKLRVSITSKFASEQYTPSLTEIRVFGPGAVTDTDPQVSPANLRFDRNPSSADQPLNSALFVVGLDGDTVSTLRYVGPEGNVLGSLDEGEDFTVDTSLGVPVYSLTDSFLTSRILGASKIRIEFASGQTRDVGLDVVDTTDLEAALSAAKAVPAAETAEYAALQSEIEKAQRLFDTASGALIETPVGEVSAEIIAAQVEALNAATSAAGGTPTDPTVPTDPTTPTSPGGNGGSTGGTAGGGADGTRPTGGLASTGFDGAGALSGGMAAAALLLLGAGALVVRHRRGVNAS